MSKTFAPCTFAVLALACALAIPGQAAQPKEPVRDLDVKAFFVPELYISSSHAALDEALAGLPNREAWESFLGGAREGFANPAEIKVWIDPRSGTATNIMGAFPLIPGNGVGNRLTVDGLRLGALRAEGVDARVVEAAVRGFIAQHAALLGIDVAQLGEARVTQINPDLWQVYIPQVYQGIPVRHGHLAASISHGNLVTIGTETWGNVADLSARAELPAEAALHAGFAFVDGPASEDVLLQPAQLEVIPVAGELHAANAAADGERAGYRHRLVWSFVFQRPPDDARWEVLVDARSGEVLALQDMNQYVQRQVTGGVYPVTSTEVCSTPLKCGSHAVRLADALRQHRPRRAQQLHEQRRHLRLDQRQRDHHLERPLRADRRHLRRHQRHRSRQRGHGRQQRPARLHDAGDAAGPATRRLRAPPSTR